MTNYLESNNIIEEKIYIGEIPAILFRPKMAKGYILQLSFIMVGVQKKSFKE